jgi:hypothetical protein
MNRFALRGLLLALLLVFAASAARAQNAPDRITVRQKDGTAKTFDGTFSATAAGFQIVAADKKVLATVNPDDVLKVVIGDLPGADRPLVQAHAAKEEKRDWEGARKGYEDLLKKAATAPDRTKRHLEYKRALMTQRVADELDYEKDWAAKADEAAKEWTGFFTEYAPKGGWELWPATRSQARIFIERNKFDEAARAWNRLGKSADMPPDAKAEAALQELDLNIRTKDYGKAEGAAGELLKSAIGSRKDRLAIYELAAKHGAKSKFLEGAEAIRAEMNKTKDAGVHATGFSMMAELYLAGGKPRDAMWSFLWVETVLNQDREEVFKAISRLANLFEAQMDDDQLKKYRDKLKRYRSSF